MGFMRRYVLSLLLKVTFAQIPPEEAEESYRSCLCPRYRYYWIWGKAALRPRPPSERQVLLLRQNDLIQTPSLETFYLLWKGQRDTFLILDKKRQLPIMLSGLDSSYLFCGCCRLAPDRETSRLTLVCASNSVMENSCLSTTTHFYRAIWTWSSTTSVLLHNRHEQKSFRYRQIGFWWRSNRAPSAIKFSVESSSRQVHLRRGVDCLQCERTRTHLLC